MPLTALPNITSAPSIGAQTRLYLAEIDDSVAVPHSGLPTLITATPPSGVSLWNTDYAPLGCVKTNKLKAPVRKRKPIPCGLEAARWTVQARAELGSLDVTCLDFAGEAYDATQWINKRCVAALVTETEDGTTQRVIYCVDWQPSFELDNPEGDGEASISMAGDFSRMLIDQGGNSSYESDLG
jgi:hypothetical protein